MRRHYLGMSGGAVASKLLGALREILLARFFGTGAVSDAYRASLTATLSPVHLLTTHLVQTSFIPLFRRCHGEDPERAAALYRILLLCFVALGLLLGALLFLGAEAIVGVLVAGFDAQRQAIARAMLRVMALGVPPYLYCALLSSLGAAQRDFLIPSLRPGLQNVGMLVMITVAALAERPVLAAYGFTITYWALALGATLLLRRRGELPAPAAGVPRAWIGELLARLWQPLRPLLGYSALLQASLLIERHLSSRVGDGTIAALEYARFVTESAFALLIVPLGLVGLSHFADLRDDELAARAERILGLLLLALIPVSAFLVINGRELLSLLYQRGAFDARSLELTTRALLGLGAGLWIVSASAFLRGVFHARMRNHEVLRAEGWGIALQVGFLLLTYRVLGILALGLGPAVAALVALAIYARRSRLCLRAGWRA
ncbi:MAG: hypothetical protein GF330_03875, partial [Candidatus Eisenbacteria bacterium]|nr:hypothetical protein [Candidatus Eisenbacteria bacterium]